jgi:hypothetical protein
MSDGVGVFEHALFTAPRVDHGYCTDDVARALAVLVREPARTPALDDLAETCLTFLERAQLPDGRFYNRLSATTGAWSEIGSADADGRALFGLGLAAALPDERGGRALACFEKAAGLDSVSPRANAWAMLGACAAYSTSHGHPQSATLLRRARGRIGAYSGNRNWPWPESRLTYDNARLAEARIAAGLTLGEPALVDEGIMLLEWLVSVESHRGHFSFTPAGGRGPGELPPAFDQQPLEAGSMADACATAFDATGDERWAGLVVLAAEWFLGRNDTGVLLFDPESGGCCDGLMREGRNENQGAESTLALIGAFQQAGRVQAATVPAAQVQPGTRRSAFKSSSIETVAAPTLLSAAPYVR